MSSIEQKGSVHIRPYILAGGKSSRMGRDKAMLELEGRTLLARTVEMLHGVEGLGAGSDTITIAGQRDLLEGADRSIPDRYPGCGPLGGMEAALDDLQRQDSAEWAFFVPVDMPLLRSHLIDRLLKNWTTAIESDSSIRVCLIELEGKLQPLVSLVHLKMHGEVKKALAAGHFKVAQVLQSDVTYRASITSDDSPSPREREQGLVRVETTAMETYAQFTNVNTEADLIGVATLFKHPGPCKS